eukprot:4192187-Alexandrium_andersonii.AAC.1
MDTIPTMESEFVICLHAHLTKLWQHTLRLEYGRVTDAQMEVYYGLVNDEDVFQNEAAVAAMVRDFHSTILHIIRKMTGERRKFRKSNVDMAARIGH